MKAGNKVKVLTNVYSIFDVGSEYKIIYTNDDMIYLVDPFYEGTDEESLAVWPFMEDEVELVEEKEYPESDLLMFGGSCQTLGIYN